MSTNNKCKRNDGKIKEKKATQNDDPNKYPKLSGGGGSQGTDFQIKLLVYCLLKGCDETFLLSTENKTTGKFDDVVFETEQSRFLIQAKHKVNKAKKLTWNELFPIENNNQESTDAETSVLNSTSEENQDEEKNSGGFNIYKYMNSFPNIKNSDNASAVILCTNMGIDLKKLNKDFNSEIRKIFLETTNTIVANTNRNFFIQKNIPENHIFGQIEGKIICICFDINHLEEVKSFIQATNRINVDEDKINEFLIKFQIILMDVSVLDDNIRKKLRGIKIFNNFITDKFAINFLCEEIKLWFQSSKGIYLNEKKAVGYFCNMRSQYYIMTVKNELLISFKEPKENQINGCTKIFVKNKTFYKTALIKILQCTSENNTFFLNPEDELYIQNQIIETFKLDRYTSIVVPVFDKSAEKLDIDAAIKIVKENKDKKIMLLTVENNKFGKKIPTENIINYVLKFSDLSAESQSKILEKKIKFQDEYLSISEIYGSEQDKMDETILLKFISEKNITVNEKNENCTTYVKQLKRFYIKRNIHFNGKPNTGKYPLLGRNSLSETDFCRLILNGVENQTKSKFILLSDVPGIGKSTLLSNMECIFRKTPYWVIKLNLRDCTEILLEAKEENWEFVDAKELFPKIDSTYQNIFKLPDKVIILIDSIDEIAPEYTDIVLKTLVNISSSGNIKRIVMASRPHVLKDIVDATNPVICEVDPFSHEDSQTFVLNYWKFKLKLDKLDKAKMYSQHLFKSLEHSVGFNRTKSFVGIPLQTKMIAEIFIEGYNDENNQWLGCKEYLESGEMSFPKKMNISKLFDMFINRKRQVYFNQQGNAKGNARTVKLYTETFNNSLEMHTVEALKLLFDKKYYKHFEIATTPLTDVNSLFDMGIVMYIEGKVQFVHQTFAEYFVAKYFVKLIKNKNLSLDFIEFLINDVFLKFDKRQIIVLFMEHLLNLEKVEENMFESFALTLELSKQTELEVLAARGCFNILTLVIKKCRYPKELLYPIMNDNTFLHFAASYNATEFAKILIEKGHCTNEKNLKGSIPLHLAIDNNCQEIMDFLLSINNDILIKDINEDSLLHYAARMNNVNLATYLINQKIDLNMKNLRGETPLHQTIIYKSKEIFRLLMYNNCNIIVRDKQNDTPLHFVAKVGDCNIADELIKANHKVDVKNMREQFPLHYAIANRKEEMIEYLLEKYENINDIKDIEGNTLLHYAAKFNHFKTAEKLLSKGHDVDVKNNTGQLPIHFAVSRRSKDMIKLLLDDTNVKFEDGNSLLHIAAKLNDLDLATILVNAKQDINVTNLNQQTPLQVAIISGHKEMIQFLMTGKYYNTSRDINGDTLLHAAVKKGDVETAKALIEQGHVIDRKNNRQETPLHLAIACKNNKLCLLLIENGHSMDIFDEQSNTVIHFAAKMNDVYLAKLYKERGYDLNVINASNKTPLYFAIVNKHKDIAIYLLDNGHRVNIRDLDGNTLLHHAAMNNNIEIAALVIEKGHKVNVRNVRGHTPLYFSIYYKCKDMSKFLIQNDHSIFDEDCEKNTLLHIAAKTNEVEISKLLIELNVENIFGETPLYVAIYSNSKDVIEYLLAVDINLDINRKYTASENTLLHEAVLYNDVDIVVLLKRKGHLVNIRNAKGLTPLHIAIANKYRNIIASLITGIDDLEVDLLHYAAENNAFQIADLLPKQQLNQKDSDGYTPLFLAVKNKSKGMFDFLIEADADIRDTDKDGNTLLHCAAFEGNFEAAVVLVEKNHPINVENLNGETPLHRLMASTIERNSAINIIKLLLDHGHRIDIEDKSGNTLLHYACKLNAIDVIKILLDKNHNLHIINAKGESPLHVSIDSGSTESTKLLLSGVENNNVVDREGNTLLHYAVRKNDVETTSLLIFKRYEVNVINNRGETLVHLLIQKFNYKLLVFLLSNGVNPHVILQNGNTLLHLAAEKNNLDLAALLTAKGLSVNAVNSKKQTPLHIAIKNKSKSMSKFLLGEEIDVNCKEIDGNSYLHYAAKEDDIEIADLLLEKGHYMNVENLRKESPLYNSIQCRAKRMTKFLLDKGHNIETKDTNQNTLVHLAVKANDIELALLLIERGHEVNVINSNNETPLYWSVARKFKNITKLLLEKKHGIHYLVLGNTLLHTAVTGDDVETAALLIEHGHKIDTRNEKNETPFYYAVKHKRKEMTNFLFNHEDNNRTLNAEIAILLVKTINYMKSSMVFSISRDIMIRRYNDMSLLLLQNEGTIVVNDDVGNTLLHLVSETNDTKVGDLLIRCGHDINLRNSFEITPLYFACMNNSRDMCRLLLQKDHVDFHCPPGYDNESLLHWAVLQHDLKRVDLLLKKGHDVNVRNFKDETPLQIAFKHKFKSIIKRLLQQDEIDFASTLDEEGNTLLHFAVEDNDIDTTDILLKKGLESDIRNLDNDTPIHIAFKLKLEEILQRLLFATPDFNVDDITDNKGNTLLHFAVDKNNLELVNFLIREKHLIKVLNVHAETPVHLALNKRYIDILKILLRNTEVDLKDIVDSNNTKLIELAAEDVELENILLETSYY
ncbi:uncharacterized protein LOC130896874 [Diorhabda carinulata]|uniref:uncharacterized protein LOC130896874 n=1 Tax=Diorhabda carinulata TaxID=1163345 RepID=UPI0025A04C45|nr:uncharacterized protein LOC130896874 [Diorhabda carinulata]